jgi:hypothetical protein
MPVYFIQAGEGGPVKIGFANNPYERVAGLQTGHPEVLRLRAIMPGSAADEAALHQRFSGTRIRGEWFEPCQSIMEIIAQYPVDHSAHRRASQDFPIIEKLGGRETAFELLQKAAPGKIQTIHALRMWLARRSIPGWALVIFLQVAEERSIEYSVADLILAPEDNRARAVP